MRFRTYTENQLQEIPQVRRLSPEQVFAMRVVSSVLPFRTNQYVINHLIDWDHLESDPIFQMTFPQAGMLAPRDFDAVASLLRQGADQAAVAPLVQKIRRELNPHPAGQWDLNRAYLDDEPEGLQGIQHKYRETVLFFPTRGQTCHSYCTFCFRWPQFVGERELFFAAPEARNLHRYLAAHPEVSDLLVTGGDPLVMKTRHLETLLEPLLEPRFEHVRNLRLGTKALTFWPYRFLGDPEADDLLRLLEKLVRAGKHVSLMAHFNHWRELEPEPTREAVRRVLETGTMIRTQGPLLAHVNDDPGVWERMWRTQVQQGMMPYYMFVERDTGARRYFEVPLVRCWSIYRDAMSRLSGLARTARGPSMSAGPGKIEVQGVAEIGAEKVLVLRFLQGRDPDWVLRPFFARFDETATWLDQLRPAANEERFFFQDSYDRMRAAAAERRPAAAGRP